MRVAWLAGVLALATATLALAGGFAKGPTLRVGVKPVRAVHGHELAEGDQLSAEVLGARAEGSLRSSSPPGPR